MKLYVVIATMARGVLAEREPLDDDGQKLASRQHSIDCAEDERKRSAYYRAVKMERDPPLSRIKRLSEPSAKVERMMELAAKAS